MKLFPPYIYIDIYKAPSFYILFFYIYVYISHEIQFIMSARLLHVMFLYILYIYIM